MELLPQMAELSLASKLQLVEYLWDQIAESAEELPVPDWQKDELDQRKMRFAANVESGIDWDVARQRIQKRDV